MPGISRVGVDIAGGLITGVLQNKVKLEGNFIAVVGAAIASHGSSIHIAATMAQGSSKVFAAGIAICRAGDLATCGHSASGSSKGFAG